MLGGYESGKREKYRAIPADEMELDQGPHSGIAPRNTWISPQHFNQDDEVCYSKMNDLFS